ncbi:uncharacterized protein LOC131996268 [Stomoxys calcitrans]|uniref:uncharacterized protein LOC131996268 n=1 Tax=Stomoxys calcitrans TaxID=35570 RepID=UPI0027E24EAF|nr:uncharacterized protein LOC131996268 [Stomoxys calcitrans]
MANIKFLFALSIMATLAIKVFAIHCYQCGSLGKKKCGEPFKPEENMKFDCDKEVAPKYIKGLAVGVNATGCMIQIVESPLGGDTYILRSCYFGDTVHTDNGCVLDPQNVGQKLGSCSVCTTDVCNSSSSIAIQGILTVLLLSLTFMFS